jgi:diaminohydroxyphosphoribosylaminopyrimidine deaminase/5-amino-6-(5-phosphoribosylamino)uracil reductase
MSSLEGSDVSGGDSGSQTDGAVNEDHMRTALALASKGRFTAHPNPAVGAVVVREDRVIGMGYHRGPGSPHAEAAAIADAGELADGADLYVTLEPCVHRGRTPPCVESIASSGIRRVFVGAMDPDEKVSGAGVQYLRQRGIRVVTGVLEQESIALDLAYFHHRRTGYPFVRYKAAATLDGFVAAADGSSKWITSEEARRDAQVLRAQCDAIVVGANTVEFDDPSLTCRLEGYSGPQPLRIVFDSTGRMTGKEKIFSSPGSTMVVTTLAASKRLLEAFRSCGFEAVSISASDSPEALGDLPPVALLAIDGEEGSGENGIRRGGDPAAVESDSTERGKSVRSALKFLGALGIVEMLLEGGPTLAGVFFEEGLVDEMVLYIGQKILGGGGLPILSGHGAKTIQEAGHWPIVEIRMLGGDAKLVARPGDPEPPTSR